MRKEIVLISICMLVIFGHTLSQNYVIHFDGENDLVSLGGSSGNNIRSIEFWFKSNQNIIDTLQYERITFIMRNSDDQFGEFGVYIGYNFLEEQGRITFVRQVQNEFHYIYSDANSWDMNVWYHVAAVIDPVEGMKLYIDGILQDDMDSSTQPTEWSTEMTTIGCWGDKLNRWFHGEIDEVRFWDYALSQSEIEERMCDTIDTQNAIGLAGYWKMDEGAGHTITDHSGFENHADIFGGIYEQDSVCITTFIKDFNTDHSSLIYPNPASNNVTIQINSNRRDAATWYIVSSGGEIVLQGVYNPPGNLVLDTSSIPKGIYLVKIFYTEDLFLTNKLVII